MFGCVVNTPLNIFKFSNLQTYLVCIIKKNEQQKVIRRGMIYKKTTILSDA